MPGQVLEDIYTEATTVLGKLAPVTYIETQEKGGMARVALPRATWAEMVPTDLSRGKLERCPRCPDEDRRLGGTFCAWGNRGSSLNHSLTSSRDGTPTHTHITLRNNLLVGRLVSCGAMREEEETEAPSMGHARDGN